MDGDYLSHTPSYFNDTAFLESPQIAQNPSPEEEGQLFDIPQYCDYETSSWINFEDGTTPSTSSPESYYQDVNTPSMPAASRNRKTSSIKPRDPDISRQNRRRAQNRQSQRQFRERKQKAYDEVVTQLHSQNTLISKLRAENTMLYLQIERLKHEKQGALEAVVRFVQSMGLSGLGRGSGMSGGREEAEHVGVAAGAEKGEGGNGNTVALQEIGV